MLPGLLAQHVHRPQTTAMNWQNDPEIQQKMRERQVRNGILRTAVLWTPFFVAAGGGLIYFAIDKFTGGTQATWFLLVVLVILSVLFGSQAIQAIQDLVGQPHTMTGEVTRRWARSDMLVMKTHYVRIDGKIFRGDVDILIDIKVGDRVEIRYYPHSAIIVAAERIKVAAQPGPAAQAEA